MINEPTEPQKTAADPMDGGQARGQEKHFLIRREVPPGPPHVGQSTQAIELLSNMLQLIFIELI